MTFVLHKTSNIIHSSGRLKFIVRNAEHWNSCLIQKRSISSKDLRNASRSSRDSGYALLVIPVATFMLGVWQVKRRKWKLDLIDNLEMRQAKPSVPLPEDLSTLQNFEYRKVQLRGEFDHKREIQVMPRSLIKEDDQNTGGGLISAGQSSIGAYIITPFKIEGRQETILVNRGWVPKQQVDPNARKNGQVEGIVDLEGVVRLTEKRPQFGQKNEPSKGRWFYRDIEELAQYLQTDPYFVDAVRDGTVPGGPIGGQTRVSLRNDHLSYIFTWFSLSAATSFMWIRRYVLKLV